MRRISFALTTDAILNRSKTVTRRLGWEKLGPGERLLAVDKLRTRSAQKLAVIEIVSVRREKLNAITNEDVIREGDPFPRPEYQRDSVDIPRKRFVEEFCRSMKCVPDTIVTRIEFRYIEP